MPATKTTAKKASPKKVVAPANAVTAAKEPFSKKTMALFRKACAERGIKPEPILKNGIGMPEADRKSVLAYAMLCVIIKWVNKDWTPDYLNGNPKYYTWHWVKADKKRPAGFGFSGAHSSFGHTPTGVGSRLCFGDSANEQKWRKALEELYLAYKL